MIADALPPISPAANGSAHTLSDGRNSAVANDGELRRPIPEVETRDLPNLDILRAFAVLAVFGAHLAKMVSGTGPIADSVGRAGVLIFFVHTTLVLLHSIERSEQTGWRLFADFYVRRVFRIYPLSLFVIAMLVAFPIPTTVEAGLELPYHWIGWRAVLDNALLIQNLTRQPDISGPLWTLPLEVQMYAVLPLLYFCTRRAQASLRVVVWVATMIVTVGYLALMHGIDRPQFVYLPCFAAGVLAARKAKLIFPSWSWPIAIAFGIVLFSLPGTLFFPWEWSACAALGLAIPLFHQTQSRFAVHTAAFVARYSYGIYLTHIPLMWVCFRALRAPASVQWMLFAVFAIAVPIVLFSLIEAPMIAIGRKIAAKEQAAMPVVLGRSTDAGAR